MDNTDRVFLSPPAMRGSEFQYLEKAFSQNWIAPVGPDIGEFEAALSKHTGSPYVAALSSGTAALHLALILLGVGHGDEVIVSSFTFAASANPLVVQGATPIFVDSEERTWNLDPVLLEEAIVDRSKRGKKPKAVIAVHLYGMPFEVDAILELCTRYEIPLIEDAAEALGSTWRGRNLGTFGRLGVLSFNGNKIITTSGGGALLSDDPDLISRARHLATQARDPAPHYQHSHIGFNYRLSNLLAALGRGQLEQLGSFVARRRALYDDYARRLNHLPGVAFLKEPSADFRSNRWLTTLLIDPTMTNGIGWQQIHAAMTAQNIEVRPLWKPLHLQPVFQDTPRYVNGTAERLFSQGLCLPSGTELSRGDFERVCDVIERQLQARIT